LFNDLLRTQLIIKGIIAETEWPVVRDSIFYDFLQDGHFAELKILKC
jgi:Bacteriophage T4-like capsid assembly protein (Gp20).